MEDPDPGDKKPPNMGQKLKFKYVFNFFFKICFINSTKYFKNYKTKLIFPS